MDEAGHTHESSRYRRGWAGSDALPIARSAIIEAVSSALSSIGIEQRRRVAATLALFATPFMAVGVVAATGATTAVLTGFAALAFVVAVLLGLMTWGVVRSIKLDVTERRLPPGTRRAARGPAPR